MSAQSITLHSTPRILTETPRDLVIAGQHKALDRLMFLRREDPAFTAEETINRAKLPRPDTRVLVHAVMAGVITPEEAVVFWHRMRG